MIHEEGIYENIGGYNRNDRVQYSPEYQEIQPEVHHDFGKKHCNDKVKKRGKFHKPKTIELQQTPDPNNNEKRHGVIERQTDDLVGKRSNPSAPPAYSVSENAFPHSAVGLPLLEQSHLTSSYQGTPHPCNHGHQPSPYAPTVINQQPQPISPNIIITNNATGGNANATNINNGGLLGLNGMRFWSTGLFACMSDVSSCCAGLLCTPCYLCYVTDKIGENACIHCFVLGAGTAMRAQFRAQNNIQGSICSDCLVMNFCLPCALCQMSRELDKKVIVVGL